MNKGLTLILIFVSVILFSQAPKNCNCRGDRVLHGYVDSLGKAHGVYASYFPSGILKEEGMYEHGKRIGVWRLYDKYGWLIRTTTVRDGKNCVIYEK